MKYISRKTLSLQPMFQQNTAKTNIGTKFLVLTDKHFCKTMRHPPPEISLPSHPSFAVPLKYKCHPPSSSAVPLKDRCPPITY